MKIVTLLGSPRPNGNSITIAMHFRDPPVRLGVQLRTIALNELEYHGCQKCMMCTIKPDSGKP